MAVVETAIVFQGKKRQVAGRFRIGAAEIGAMRR